MSSAKAKGKLPERVQRASCFGSTVPKSSNCIPIIFTSIPNSTPSQPLKPSQSLKPPVLPDKPPGLPEKPLFKPEKPLIVPSNPSVDPTPKREQFKAFGIEAHRTRAFKNEICLDFVSKSRWCQWERNCHRVHPLDKAPHQYLLHSSLPATIVPKSSTLLPQSPHEDACALPIEDDAKSPRVKLPPPSKTTHNAQPKRLLGKEKKAAAKSTRSSTPTITTDTPIAVRSSPVAAPSNPATPSPSDSGSNPWTTTPDTDWLDSSSNSSGSTSLFSTESTSSSRTSVSGQRHTVSKYPRPRFSETCINYLRNRCDRGYACNFVHEDLEYDDEPDTQKKVETISATVHDHIKLRLTAGFELVEVITGFESTWVVVGNIPTRVTEAGIRRFLESFGLVLEVHVPSITTASSKTAKARYATAAEALAACASNGKKALGAKLTIRLPVNNSKRGNASIRDTSVRVEWEVPHKTVYAGYKDVKTANEVIAMTHQPFQDRHIRADLYVGIPALDAATVRFQYMDPSIEKEEMKFFKNPTHVAWTRPVYDNLEAATRNVKRLMKRKADLLSFDIMPPPYKDGIIRAWANYATVGDAKAAAAFAGGLFADDMNKVKIHARHVQSISYTLSPETFRRVSSDIDQLSHTVWRAGVGRTSLTVAMRPMTVGVKISGPDLRELVHVKSELEKILTGEVVRGDGQVAWDDFFTRSAGFLYLQDLEQKFPRVSIQRDSQRRLVRLFGSSSQRAAVRRIILEKVAQLRRQQLYIIRLDGRFTARFVEKDFPVLEKRLGQDNIWVDLWTHCVKVRGDVRAFEIANTAVNLARQKHASKSNPTGSECPVCFNSPNPPLPLSCGHTYCRPCLTNYLKASVDLKPFPITCLGASAKCTQRIPLQIASSLLSPADFDSIIAASLSSHIQHHSSEFHFCPTPDCPQVYRSAPPQTKSGPSPSRAEPSAGPSISTPTVVLQCPSCLIRICTTCHQDAHDGLDCKDADGGESLFQDWMRTHNVKPCPGCNVPIERGEGCNHMVCTLCNTHICWVCLQTFPGGTGIYGHMMQEHGDFGLGPIV